MMHTKYGNANELVFNLVWDVFDFAFVYSWLPAST